MEGAVEIVGVKRGDSELFQGQRLPGRVINLPGQAKRAAALIGSLGEPA